MCAPNPNHGLVRQRVKTTPPSSASMATVLNSVTLNEVYELQLETIQLFQSIKNRISSHDLFPASDLNDKPLRACEAWSEASLSRTMFYDIQNPKHSSYDETFPQFFKHCGSKRWWKSHVIAWVKSHDPIACTLN